jgi:hypothetical protein
MTLQEKFNATVPIEFGGMYEPLLNDCEKVADEFAIGFKLWSAKNIDLLLYVNSSNPIEIEKELLEIYKKEKGL